MSNKYKHGEKVPSEVLCARLDELAHAVTQGAAGINREFSMRVPAELDHDADLVLSGAAMRIRELEAELSTLDERVGSAVPIKVIGWIYNHEVEDWMDESHAGGAGGYFKKGMRWADYLLPYGNLGREHAEALRTEILLQGMKQCKHTFNGDPSGNRPNVPVFSDGTVATFGYRMWGDLMAAIWSEEENKDYEYWDFY